MLENPYYDKITVVAMETVMLSHISFPFGPEQFNQVRRPGTIFTTVQSSKNEFS